MHIELTVRDGVPIYRQVFNQVSYMISAGHLTAGDELPAIRGLAEQLSITPNTVAKAYEALEAAGLVVKRHGAGTFVAELSSPLKKHAKERMLGQRIDGLLAEARQLDYSFQELLELIAKRQAKFDKSWSRE